MCHWFLAFIVLFTALLSACGAKDIPTPSGLILKPVEGGTFTMGSEQASPESRPAHEVTLSSYLMADREITQDLWFFLMEQNPSSTHSGNLPVEGITWWEALEFCNRLSLREGLDPVYEISGWQVRWKTGSKGYRLPTEAEWEYAARVGRHGSGDLFSGSRDSAAVAWLLETSGRRTHEPAQKAPNTLGIYDMTGNVAEWCWDWWGPYPPEAQSDPRGAASGVWKVVRGGHSLHPAQSSTVLTRFWNSASNFNLMLGLRVVRSL